MSFKMFSKLISSFFVLSALVFAQQGIAPSQTQQSTAQTQPGAQTQNKPDAAKQTDTQPAADSKAAEAAKSATTESATEQKQEEKKTGQNTTDKTANKADKKEQKDSKEALPQSDAKANEAESAAEPMTPETKIYPEPKEALANDPLLAPAKKPDGKVSLLGGTVKSIDQIRNRLTLDVYKAGTMKYRFDDRTRIMKDGLDVTQLAIHKGDRIYVDSQLDKGNLFARNIVIHTGKTEAAANGQVISYNAKSGDVAVRDNLTSQPVRFRLGPATEYRNNGKNASASELRPGALVKVVFGVSPAERNIAKSVEILATPGSTFSFFGRVTHLDLRTGVIGIENKADGKLYEVRFNPADTIAHELKIGAEVVINASFDGAKYAAKSVEITKQPGDELSSSDDDKSLR